MKGHLFRAIEHVGTVMILTMVCALTGRVEAQSSGTRSAGSATERLRSVSEFASIPDRTARSIALFEEAGKVLQHPRCLNCHPAGDRPTQGMERTPHQPWVRRGEDGTGAVGLRCNTCHQAENFDPGRVPGHPTWKLAPIEMAWQGKTLGQICRQLTDPGRNGGRTLDDIVHHMANDSLVGWAWSPGAGREPAPGSQSAFGALIRAWVESGAACPNVTGHVRQDEQTPVHVHIAVPYYSPEH
jgi:hypothetical protein